MEQETLFTASKWDILTELAKQRRSPVELAKLLNTSVANISQQLRLLEMAGLVKSKRISNREKGLPRVQYSLAGNLSYLIATAQEFVDKKFHKLTERNKVVLRIWFLDNTDLHYYLEKAFWSIDQHLGKIDAMLLDKQTNGIRIILATPEKDLKNYVHDLEIENPDGITKAVTFQITDSKSFEPGKKTKHNKEKYYVLHDPDNMFSEKKDD